MARAFKEVAHLRTDMNKYGAEYDRIFGKKKDQEPVEEKKEKIVTLMESQWSEIVEAVKKHPVHPASINDILQVVKENIFGKEE